METTHESVLEYLSREENKDKLKHLFVPEGWNLFSPQDLEERLKQEFIKGGAEKSTLVKRLQSELPEKFPGVKFPENADILKMVEVLGEEFKDVSKTSKEGGDTELLSKIELLQTQIEEQAKAALEKDNQRKEAEKRNAEEKLLMDLASKLFDDQHLSLIGDVAKREYSNRTKDVNGSVILLDSEGNIQYNQGMPVTLESELRGKYSTYLKKDKAKGPGGKPAYAGDEAFSKELAKQANPIAISNKINEQVAAGNIDKDTAYEQYKAARATQEKSRVDYFK